MNNAYKTLHISILTLAVFSSITLRPATARCSGPYFDGDVMLAGGAMVFVGIPAAVGAVIAMVKNLNAVRTRERSKASVALDVVTSVVCLGIGTWGVAAGQKDGVI